MSLPEKNRDHWSTCDLCKKEGSFIANDFEKEGLFGFIGFSRDQLNELGLNHLNKDSIRCEQCLTIKESKGE
tara:strand:+ start:18392 stop:18607 length:216 start_codon:yes stop_codon:yes gene_type:complete